jgi:hypothetical protein
MRDIGGVGPINVDLLSAIQGDSIRAVAVALCPDDAVFGDGQCAGKSDHSNLQRSDSEEDRNGLR